MSLFFTDPFTVADGQVIHTDTDDICMVLRWNFGDSTPPNLTNNGEISVSCASDTGACYAVTYSGGVPPETQDDWILVNNGEMYATSTGTSASAYVLYGDPFGPNIVNHGIMRASAQSHARVLDTFDINPDITNTGEMSAYGLGPHGGALVLFVSNGATVHNSGVLFASGVEDLFTNVIRSNRGLTL